MTKKTVSALIVNDDKVLLGKCAKECDLKGLWMYPGGKIEEGESELVALAREISEEAGIDIKDCRQLEKATIRTPGFEDIVYLLVADKLLDVEPDFREFELLSWVYLDEADCLELSSHTEKAIDIYRLLKEEQHESSHSA